ncbi:MAG: hypothetical protein LBT68_01475 [Spirochaetales bacterium]|jgi:hypothetical protein|nr:hypothetical protein [Spirochaetales bacterium]
MKRSILFFLFILLALCPTAFSQSLSAGIGADFPNYEKSYLDIRLQYIHHLNPDVDVTLGSSFALSTHKDDGDTDADFLIPVDLGVNFIFPINDIFAYYFGIGATAQFFIPDDGVNRIYPGPFVTVGLRAGVHPFMEWYLEARQDLLFGEPDWLNTSTRLSTGIIFPL